MTLDEDQQPSPKTSGDLSCSSDVSDRDYEKARAIAWRLLNRRDRTVAEMENALAERGVRREALRTVVDELIRDRYLDDRIFASRFAEDRVRLDGWGARRVTSRLKQLGVSTEYIQAAIAQQPNDEVQRAISLLLPRYPNAGEDAAAARRALQYLLRRGYSVEDAWRAIRSLPVPKGES